MKTASNPSRSSITAAQPVGPLEFLPFTLGQEG
jgi:hypothetical protein